MEKPVDKMGLFIAACGELRAAVDNSYHGNIIFNVKSGEILTMELQQKKKLSVDKKD